MKYTKRTSISGKWAKGSELVDVKKAKILTETMPMPSQFLNKDGSPKTQDVCKIHFEGIDEDMNVSLNQATISGLIDAFGEDSKNWMNKVLGVETEKMRVAGKAVTVLYLIPSGYQRIDDDNGYARLVKIDEVTNQEISGEDLIF